MKKIFLILILLLSTAGYSQVAKMTPISSPDEYQIFVPNSFTPNNDGLNDIFAPSIIGHKTFEMTIFDRWSEVLYHTNDISRGWDGTYKGNPCKENTYVYMISTIDIFETNRFYIGYLTIIK